MPKRHGRADVRRRPGPPLRCSAVRRAKTPAGARRLPGSNARSARRRPRWLAATPYPISTLPPAGAVLNLQLPSTVLPDTIRKGTHHSAGVPLSNAASASTATRAGGSASSTARRPVSSTRSETAKRRRFGRSISLSSNWSDCATCDMAFPCAQTPSGAAPRSGVGSTGTRNLDQDLDVEPCHTFCRAPARRSSPN